MAGLKSPAAAIECRPRQADIMIALDDLVGFLARDAELASQTRNLFAPQKLGDGLYALVHKITLPPGHGDLPQIGRAHV